MYIETIDDPKDIRALSIQELTILCGEIRQALITSEEAVGGHVGPNLGALELTVALHYVLNTPYDQLIFDVSHQSYTHKLLTGRKAAYLDPEHFGELSGFSSPSESDRYDLFSMGHTSTGIGLAAGLAAGFACGARFDGDQRRSTQRESTQRTSAQRTADQQLSSRQAGRQLSSCPSACQTFRQPRVAVVVGDGSLSGGLAFESLSHAATLNCGLLVVINDNSWSIAPNAGGIAHHLEALRTSNGMLPENMFKALGFAYHYLDEGHNIAKLVDCLDALKDIDRPTVLHVHTIKGYGFAPAEQDPEKWHHVGPFAQIQAPADAAATKDALASRDVIATKNLIASPDAQRSTTSADKTSADETHAHKQLPALSYPHITGEILKPILLANPKTALITAATPYLFDFDQAARAAAGEQFIDVGIAESNAITLATGLAKAGIHAFVGMYSTFVNRAIDQLWHDACLNQAAFTLLLFGASVYGTRDVTHLGFFDIPFMRNLPNLLYLTPASTTDYKEMLTWAASYAKKPVAIRVPVAAPVPPRFGSRRTLMQMLPNTSGPSPDTVRTADTSSTNKPHANPNFTPSALTSDNSVIDFSNPRFDWVCMGEHVALIAIGPAMVALAEQTLEELEQKHGILGTLILPRTLSAVDKKSLARLQASHTLIITLEDGVISGGFGEAIAAACAELAVSQAHAPQHSQMHTPCHCITRGLPHRFVDRYEPVEILQEAGLTVDQLVAEISYQLRSLDR